MGLLRLFVAAVAGLLSFFVLMIVVSLITSSPGVVIGIAIVVGFIGVPALVLNVWPGQDGGARCPEGKGLYPECLFQVSLTESEIINARPDGKVERVLLSEIREMSIITNDSGPWGADVWWAVEGADSASGCVFPQGATGERTVSEFALKLSGFDEAKFIKAMGCTSNARFSCWRAARQESNDLVRGSLRAE